MAGATWSCCHLGMFCVHHSTMHNVTPCKSTCIGSMAACMFSCNLPPALLAEWPGSLRSYCSNTVTSWHWYPLWPPTAWISTHSITCSGKGRILFTYNFSLPQWCITTSTTTKLCTIMISTTMYYSDVVPQWYYRYDTTMYNSNTTKYNVVLQWCTTMYYNVSWYHKIYNDTMKV